MRRIAMLFAACAALAAAGTAAPEKEDPVIAPEDAAEFVGQEMTVGGAVTGTHLSKRSGNLYLNLGDYRKTVSIKIPKAAVAKFPANAETWYTGKKINATGMISRERGLLRLTVSAPSALKVVE